METHASPPRARPSMSSVVAASPPRGRPCQCAALLHHFNAVTKNDIVRRGSLCIEREQTHALTQQEERKGWEKIKEKKERSTHARAHIHIDTLWVVLSSVSRDIFRLLVKAMRAAHL